MNTRDHGLLKQFTIFINCLHLNLYDMYVHKYSPSLKRYPAVFLVQHPRTEMAVINLHKITHNIVLRVGIRRGGIRGSG